MVALATLLGAVLACSSASSPDAASPDAPAPAAAPPAAPAAGSLDAAGQAAHAALRQAMAQGSAEEVGRAARAASAWQGQDPALDRDLGDALANHLLRHAEGAAMLKAAPLPDDPEWVRAARDAALRADDRAWLATLLPVELPLEHMIVDEVVRRSRLDRAVDAEVLVDVVRACALVDGRPQMGRRAVDLPVPPTLVETLRLLGAEHVVVARTTVQRPPATSLDDLWHCEFGWLDEGPRDVIPDPLPPRGLLVAAEDATGKLWVELDIRHEVAWATASNDAPAAARLLQAAALLDERRAAGDDDATARAAVLARYGAGLVPHPTPLPQPDGPPVF